MKKELKLYEDNTPSLISSGNAVAWDTETDLIAEGNVVPHLICSSFAGLNEEGTVVSHLSPQHNEIVKTLLDEHLVIGHNIAFDLSVAIKHDPSLLPLVWKTLDEGRVRDTMIREQLLNLTMHGNIDIVENYGINQKIDYSLGGLVKHYLDIDISEDKHAEDSVRMNYHIVRYQDLGDWPEKFVQYAADDPKYTGLVFMEQEIKRKECFDKIGYDPFAVEQFRVRAAFALRMIEAQGIRLDPERVMKVTEEYQTMYDDPRLVEPLSAEGIVVKARPPQPNARGTKDHQPDCRGHKEHPEWKKSKTIKDCSCPVKMNKGKEESTSVKTLHAYVWNLALQGFCEAWASDSTLALMKEDGIKEDYIEGQNKIDLDEVRSAFVRQARSDLADAKESLEDSCDPEGDNFLAKAVEEAEWELERAEKGISSPPLPDKWKLSINKEWLASFSCCHPVTEAYGERKRIQKIVTSYLPHLYTEDPSVPAPATKEQEADKYYGKKPAPVIHPSFSVLKRTGRTSSFASKNYPSFNGQQVDPRIRECCIPKEGRLFFSVDYSGMELCTAAQTCLDLFGYSTLADKINAGIDTHAFLGAQIAMDLDPMFRDIVQGQKEAGEDQRDAAYRIFSMTKGCKDECLSTAFEVAHRASHPESEGPILWGDFYKHYRKFAKPTGLGYPGGLGPKTFKVYAKATYGISVDLETATQLRDVWKDTYPEMKQYLDYIGKQSIDHHHDGDVEEDEDGRFKKKQWYAYDTPLGMHRAKCDYCSCANGKALQAIGAEGALLGTQEVIKETTLGSLAGKVFPNNFIHDEITGEVVIDGQEHEYLRKVQDLMEENFQIITPDVKISTEACLMYRWNKYAEPVFGESGNLIPWEPKKKEK